MPKLMCLCGFIHNLSPIPDDGWITVRDTEYEALLADEILRDDKTTLRSDVGAATARVVARTGRLYECPECGRLMWSLPGDPCANFKVYRPENGRRETVDKDAAHKLLNAYMYDPTFISSEYGLPPLPDLASSAAIIAITCTTALKDAMRDGTTPIQ